VASRFLQHLAHGVDAAGGAAIDVSGHKCGGQAILWQVFEQQIEIALGRNGRPWGFYHLCRRSMLTFEMSISINSTVTRGSYDKL
jgi:hypothetical protein